MRLIQVFVPSDVRDAVREALDEMAVEGLFTDAEDHRDGVVANVPVPAGAVDAVLDGLYDAGLPEDTYTVVTTVDRATIPNREALQDRFVAGPKGARGASHAEVSERARDLKPDTASYLAFAAASAIVAVGGLLLDSAIVIVGAMVIAPFAGSTLSASVGAVVSDRDMVVDSATSQAMGLVVAFVGAVVMSEFLRTTGFVPPSLAVSRIDQVSTFLTPNMLTLAIAVAAGLAGALALATDLPVSIAGVAVAAAIVPAAATAGIGVVWGRPLVVLGAVVLLFMNIVAINLAAYGTMLSLGYRSSMLRNVREHATLSLRSGAYATVVVLFLVVVVLTAGGTYQHLAFDRTVNRDVESVLSAPTYSELELVRVQTEYNDVGAVGEPGAVTVTVDRHPGAVYARLDETLQRRISDSTGRPVTVNVRYVEVQRARAPAGARPTGSWQSRLVDRADAVLARLEAMARALVGGLARSSTVAMAHPPDVAA